MNIAQVNEIRASIGLAPLNANPHNAEKRKQNQRNRAARAAENRDLKAHRNSNKKG